MKETAELINCHTEQNNFIDRYVLSCMSNFFLLIREEFSLMQNLVQMVETGIFRPGNTGKS